MPNIEKPNQHFDVITYTGNGKAVTVAGNAQISTAQSKWGNSSASFDGTGDSIAFNAETDFAFGTGDFAIEFWLRFNPITTNQTIFDFNGNTGPLLYVNNADKTLRYTAALADRITSSVTIANNTWYHIALTRSGTSTRLFINGTQSGSTYTDSNNYSVGAGKPTFGAFINGFIDDLRIYKGIAKYTANFTAPTGALAIGPTDPNWQYCVLAMPMDGTNGSTTFPTFAYNASTDLGLSFQPDLVWIKGRSGATDHALYDTTRGAQARLESNNTDYQVTSDAGVSAFNSNGFTLGNLAQVNTNSATYTAWCWKKGVTPGFEILTWTGNDTARTIPHTLGVAPEFIIVKRYTGSVVGGDFAVYHKNILNTTYLSLNTTAATQSNTGVWNSTSPTSTNISIGNSSIVNPGGQTMICYTFAPVNGFSSFGSYTGNGNANGPFINLGFRPALVIIKCSSAVANWVMFDDRRDGYNVDNNGLFPNLANAENTTDYIDMLSNGFKIRANLADVNTNAATYIYAAWAENPFNYALGR